MPNYHQTICVGHIGRDPEMRYMPNGDAVCNFSVAVTESWKDASGEKKEQVTWYRVNAFRKLAEICGQYLKKGAPVMIVGRMSERKWTDKEGHERTTWELRADSMQMLGGKRDDDNATPEQRENRMAAKAIANSPARGGGSGFDDFSDDIPF